jgi:hypothetical protein
MTISLQSQKWELFFEQQGEKHFVDYTPKFISINGSKIAVSQQKTQHGIDHDIFTWYYRISMGRLQVAKKSQIGYFSDGTINFSTVTPDSDLEWKYYEFQNNPFESKVLLPVFKGLKFKGHPLKP